MKLQVEEFHVLKKLPGLGVVKAARPAFHHVREELPVLRFVRLARHLVDDVIRDLVVRDDKPGVSNLLNILSAVTGETIGRLEMQYQGRRYAALKTDVADAVIACLEPIQKRYRELRSESELLNRIMDQGAEKARNRARETLDRVTDVVGLIRKQ